MRRGVQVRPTVDLRHPHLQVSDIDHEITKKRSAFGHGPQPASYPPQQPSRTGDAGGAVELQRVVRTACEALGRPHDAPRVLAVLEAEWLSAVDSVASLSDDGWRELKLPLGLKEQLKRLLEVDPLIAGSRDPAAKRERAAAMNKATMGTNPYGAGPPGAVATGAPRVLEEPPAVARTSLPPGGDELRHREEAGSYHGSRADPRAIALRDRLRTLCRSRGAHGLKGIARWFRIADRDKNHRLSQEEFVVALQHAQMSITPAEVSLLWALLDINEDGTASHDELIVLLNGGLNERRRHLVHVLFNHLDLTGDGAIQLEDLKLRYDPSVLGESSEHLLLNPKPPDEELAKFLRIVRRLSGAGGGHANSRPRITLQDLVRYYEGISANIDSDAYFEEMLRRAWNLPMGWTRGAPPLARSAGVADGPQPAAPHRHGLDPRRLPPPDAAASMVGRGRTETVATAAAAGSPRSAGGPHSGQALLSKLCRQLRGGTQAELYNPAVVRAHFPAEHWRSRSSMTAAKAAFRMAKAAKVPISSQAAVSPLDDSAANSMVLESQEFESAVARIFPNLGPNEVKQLRVLFDDSGHVDYEEFLHLLQSDVSEKCRKVSRELFEELAGPGAPALDLSKVSRMPPGFVDAFRDAQKVTYEDWMHFHNTVAAAAGDDDVYEAQLREAWGLQPKPGAVPTRASTPNRSRSATSLARYKTMSSIKLG
eukprot:gnl/TRDRNA2_/TRDRNA2_149668_c0_seq1.p1 gnl/TRDRNA2_/TRDRNA2_149668_c0~~gnl/TRDRNA2_/TRDRNA2_149668_c0_seq1.p1  ORF type:complete len:709 (-),score=117.81 gnl/TRDRNA2_/TRDRNA2_149668_c0_seq1:185-2311(-)